MCLALNLLPTRGNSSSAACLGFASTGYSPDHGSQTAFIIEAHGEIWFLNVGEKNTAMKLSP